MGVGGGDVEEGCMTRIFIWKSGRGDSQLWVIPDRGRGCRGAEKQKTDVINVMFKGVY